MSMFVSGEGLSSIWAASARRLEQAALPSPRFKEERLIVLPEVAVEFCVALESSELMDNPDKLRLETLQRVIILWLVFILMA